MTGFAEISQNEMMVVDGGEWTDDQITAIMAICVVTGATYGTVVGAIAGLYLGGPLVATFCAMGGFYAGVTCSRIIVEAFLS